MRNRALHEALRNFALEAAALLTDDLRAGAEIEFDVVNDGGPRAPALYHYRPRIDAFLAERWERLRELPACGAACRELGAGAAGWLRVNGLRGEQAEPALRAMLERLYEDATSFGFPEERFERVYAEVEQTLYRDTAPARALAPLRGAWLDSNRLELAPGLVLVRGDRMDAPPEAVYPEGGDGDPEVLVVLERDLPAGESIGAAEAAARFASVVTALRLWAPGHVFVGAPGWRSSAGGRWEAIPVGAALPAPAGRSWDLRADEEEALGDFFELIEAADPPRTVAWALGRFEMGCERRLDAEALPDFLLALRSLLDATSDAGEASLGLRVAALCAEDGGRRDLQRRVEAALALERFVMGGTPRVREEGGSPRQLVAEVEGHLRALLRDVLCGYLDADLKAVADDILVETTPEPFIGEIRVRDLRAGERPESAPPRTSLTAAEAAEEEPPPPPRRFAREPDPEPEAVVAEAEEPDTAEPDTAELEALEPEPDREALPYRPDPVPVPQPLLAEAVQTQLEGVTPSADWGFDDPDDFSAPV